jgi:hypothetical protein
VLVRHVGNIEGGLGQCFRHCSFSFDDSQYREEDVANQGAGYTSNIMFDRRVVRGNTYAARILPADVSLTDTQAKASTQ